ncbi:MAG: hypothetical protein AAFP00_18155, partial [Bacteroidota bacterium]
MSGCPISLIAAYVFALNQIFNLAMNNDVYDSPPVAIATEKLVTPIALQKKSRRWSWIGAGLALIMLLLLGVGVALRRSSGPIT